MNDEFNVNGNLAVRLKIKYDQSHRDNAISFKFKELINVVIQQRISDDFLKLPAEEIEELFKKLCLLLIETCMEYQIPFKQSHIFILTDDEINKGLWWPVLDNIDGSLWSYIFISPIDLTSSQPYWNFTFWHELSHAWAGIKPPTNETYRGHYEICTDLIAICTLRKAIPYHKRLYRDIIDKRSYLGRDRIKYKDFLNDPELSLKRFIETLK